MIALRKQIEAIEGFLELGMLHEAAAEFDQIDPQYKSTVEVMELQMTIYRRILKWEEVAVLAQCLAKSFPDNAKWHLEWAEAICECERIREARDVLASVQDRFRDNAELQYTLARYESVIGNYEATQRNLERAYELDNATRGRSREDFEFNGFWDWLNEQKPRN